MLRKTSAEPSIHRNFVAFILLFNTLTWYSMMPIIMKYDNLQRVLIATYTQVLLIRAVFSVAIIGSGVVGAILSNKISRLKFLYLWMILGIVTSLSSILLSRFTVTNVLVVSILFGVSFGLGIPSCFSYFADYTLVENRGRMGGITMLIVNLSAPLFVIAISAFNLVIDSVILTMWRASGLIIFFLSPGEETTPGIKRSTSFISIFHDKSFLFYFVAWLMFNLIDRIEWPVLEYLFSDYFYYLASIIDPIICGFSAFIAGLLSDRIGRKRVVLYGLVTLGIAYAIIGIAPALEFSWYFYLVVDGMATGILWVIFILILWGDLSQPGTREKYYLIGGTPYFLSNIVEQLSAPYVSMIPAISAFSLASFFLFLAVLPLLYAPETLPERKIELRRLRKYVEKAKRLQQEYADKATGE